MTWTLPRLYATSAATGLGLLLLAGTGVSLAGWGNSHPIGQGTVSTGRIAVSSTPLTYDYRHVDFVAGATAVGQTSTTTLTGQTVMPGPLVPGDVVTVRTTITVILQGDNARASLVVNPSALVAETNLQAELVANGGNTVTLTPLDGAKPLPAGTTQWTLDSSYNGASYAATITLRIRSSKDGAAPNPSTPTATGNWWGSTLQGATAGARPIAISLNQVL